MALDRNILLIIGSGHRADAYGAADIWPVLTPHLDALAGDGLDMICAAHAPALISLFTGQHPRQHGVIDDDAPLPAITGFPGQCQQGGCHLAGVGRVGPIAPLLDQATIVADVDQHHDPDCQYLDFAANLHLLDLIQTQRQHRAQHGPFDLAASDLDNPAHDIDGFITDRAIQTIDALPRDQPWVTIVALTGPGNHLPAPKHFHDMIDPAALREPFCPADLPALDAYIDLQIPRHRIQSLQPETLAAVRAHYLARVMQIDHAVAALRDAVDRNGHADNTWIIYVSDHGMLLGERGLIGHRSFLANAVYVPLWILPPPTVEITRQDEESDRDSHGLINAVALAPTLCAIVGVDPPTGAAAPSLLPAVSGLPIGHDAMISEYANLLMLETMRYKAVFDTNTTAPLALFDLVKDPEERSDIVDATQSSNVFDMLRWQLAQSLMPLRSGVLAAV